MSFVFTDEKRRYDDAVDAEAARLIADGYGDPIACVRQAHILVQASRASEARRRQSSLIESLTGSGKHP